MLNIINEVDVNCLRYFSYMILLTLFIRNMGKWLWTSLPTWIIYNFE